MRSRSLIFPSAAIVVLLIIIGFIALSKLPTGTQLPIHWNAAGNPDRYADAAFALFMPAAFAAGLSTLFAILPRIEPLQNQMAGSAALLDTCWMGLLALMLLTQVMIAAPAFGLAFPATMMLAGLGLFLIVVGNTLPKSRPGFFVGIRTPWTIIDTDNWIATHRFGSRTMMTGGAMILLIATAPISPTARAILVCAGLTLAVVPPVAYSWWRWRKISSQS